MGYAAIKASLVPVALLILSACATMPAETSSTDSDADIERHDGAMALLPVLDAEAGPQKNMVFSPASINLAFGLLYEGAGGETRAQLAKLLPPPEDPLGYASNKDGVEAKVANALFLDRDFRFRDSYVAATRREYGAEAVKVDFSLPAPTAKIINDWASAATNGLIPQVITPSAIADDMIAVLANALYFEGLWETKLMGRREHPFLFGDGTERPFTFVTDDFDTPYARHEGWEAIRLPYRNNRYAMDILMPAKREVMSAAPSASFIEDMKRRLDGADDVFVSVEIPQFETDYDQGLIPALKAIGLTLPFETGRANFTAMVEPGQAPVKVSDVRHVTKLQVYDEGTKAAAVTTISIVTTGARFEPRKPVPFRADRPFVMVLRDLERDAVLFIGRIADPQPFEPEVEEP